MAGRLAGHTGSVTPAVEKKKKKELVKTELTRFT